MSKKTNTHPAARSHLPHRGEPVQVGPYTILAGGTQFLQAMDLQGADVLIPLTEVVLPFGSWHDIPGDGGHLRGLPPLEPDRTYRVLAAPLRDFGGVPDNWGDFLRQQVIPLLQEGTTVLAFCIGSHGRTGTFLASLIAILEPETADPVAAVRQRHCQHAVETRAQAEAVFALRGEELQAHYR